MTKSDAYAVFDESVKYIVAQRERYVENPQRHFVRTRKEPMDTVLYTLVGMGSGNTSSELEDFFLADGPAVHLKEGALPPGQSAFAQQRRKLKPEAVEDLCHEFVSRLNLKMDEEDRAQGKPQSELINMIGDGTALRFESLPAYAGPAYWHKSGSGGWYEAKLTALYSVDRQMFVDGIVHGVTDGSEPQDMCALVDRQPRPASGQRYLYLLDRGYATFNVIAHIEHAGDYYVDRMKDLGSNGIASNVTIEKELLESGKPVDVDITFRIGRSLPVTQELPEHVYNRNIGPKTAFDFFGPGDWAVYELKTRLVRIRLSTGQYVLILTNLPRDKYPPERIADLYELRWGEEVAFRLLKYPLSGLSFHAKIDKLVVQEIWAYLIKYNIVSAVSQGAFEEETELIRNEDLSGSHHCEREPRYEAEQNRKAAEPEYCEVRIELNFTDTAHRVMREFASRRMSDAELNQLLERHKQKVVLRRHEPRSPNHQRRRFYLTYRHAV